MLFRLSSALALALGFLSAQTGPVSPYSLEPGKSIEREIGPGETHTYEVRLTSGQWLRFGLRIRGLGADVVVVGPDAVRIVERRAMAGDMSTYPRIEFLTATGGVHRIQVSAVPWGQTGRYVLNVEELLPPEQGQARLAMRDAWRTAATRWFASNAIPLRTVESGQGFRDLMPLRNVIGTARIVALGEATHGTREFFQLKHRLLEFLVTQMGFTAFAIEATMPEGFDINRYVLTGEGDPAKALAGLYFWTWNTEEVLELIRWMRRYNADPRHRQKVSFYGMDMQHPLRARKVLVAYLQKVDPEEAAVAEKSFGALTNPLTDQLPLGVGPLRRQAATYQKQLLDLFDKKKLDYQRKSSAHEWELVCQHLRVLMQNSNPSDVRDRSMAENIAWILEQEGSRGKVAVWAHNGHVATEQNGMGGYLREKFGRDLVVFGFAFNEGGFQSLRFGVGAASGELRPFNVEPAPKGSLDAILAAAGHPLAAIPLRHLPSSGPVAEWINTVPLTRRIGSHYTETDAAHYFYNTPVASFYDALLFVEKTSAARALPGSGRSLVPVATRPANLGFEAGSPGQVPSDWIAAPPQLFRAASQLAFGFRVGASTENPWAGAKCAEISRPPGQHYGETTGGLGQRIQALTYRGKRIRLRAAVRPEFTGSGNQAHLWLSVSSGANILFADAMLNRPITSGDWRRHDLFADVPNGAEFIDYGLAMVGVGRVWLDDVSIEVVEPAPPPAP